MPVEKTCVIVTPYSLRKGRAGAILSRLISRSDLVLAAAQILAASGDSFGNACTEALNCAGSPLAAYLKQAFTPAPGGIPERFLALVFSGENAVSVMAEICGKPSADLPSDGITVCDSFSDVVVSGSGEIICYEPGVIVPETPASAQALLKLLSTLAAASPNIVDTGSKQDRTLVILKPENWRRNSVRPGAILDIFTRTGLRLAGCKMHRIPVADALEFYGPVRDALRSKLAPKIAAKAKALLEQEFGIRLRDENDDLLLKGAGFDFADDQFARIVEFMSGTRPDICPESGLHNPGKARCMVLVFEGENAVEKIRAVLGPTDPAKAPAGTVRGEFGSDVMVNSAHASDSPESFLREAAILRVDENTFAAIAAE